jgi:hypothetical protein
MAISKIEDLQLRNGGEFRIYATDHEHNGGVLVVGAVRIDGMLTVAFWTPDGLSAIGREYDLISKPKRLTGWVNVYPDTASADVTKMQVYKTKAKAKSAACSDCLGQAFIDTELNPQ